MKEHEMSTKATRHGSRWGAIRTLVTAIRTAMRPGSPSLGERLTSLPRLLRATFRGEYAGTTRGRLLLVLGAVAYVVSPVDLVPEAFLPLLGLADDAMVVSWIAATVINETEAFLQWERSAAPDAPGGTAGGTAGGPAGGAAGGTAGGAAGETVTGRVVG
jgi:uncharacterized membrane protein YkvA (DUF1232 family)